MRTVLYVAAAGFLSLGLLGLILISGMIAIAVIIVRTIWPARDVGCKP